MAIVFNGTDQAIKETAFATDFDQVFTLAVKFKGTVSSGSVGVVGAHNTSNTANGALYLSRRDDLGGWVLRQFGDADASTTPAVALTNDVWHSVVIVNNGNGTADLYLNGDAVKSVSYSSANKTLEDIFLGAAVPFGNDTGTIQWFNGKVAYYRRSKTAISAANAAAYNSATSEAEINAVLPDGANLISDATISGSASTLTAVNAPTYDTDDPLASTVQEVRKSSTFDIETTLGTITTATLNGVNVFDHVTGQTGTTVSFAGAATDEITTSGEYVLALGDGVGTENITVQVNVVGVAPSNNPVQKDGAALASLTGVQLRVTSGANINGTELFYSGTATTDASGNLSNIDLSSTAAAAADPVLLHMRTAAGDSIIASETVGLI